MVKYTLKDGVILKPYGINSKVTNDNLTDSMAELFIKNGKAKKTDFTIKTTTKKTKYGNSK